MLKPWYKSGLQFECTQCGNCCKGPNPGHVWVSSEEVIQIAEYLELPEEKFTRRYVRQIGMRQLSLTEKSNKDCDFWDDNRGCTIYAVRPAQCRSFPFWKEVLASKRDWEDHALKCRGMNQGHRFSLSEIDAIRNEKRDTRSHEGDNSIEV